MLWATAAKSGKAIPLDALVVESGNLNLDGFGRVWSVGKGKGRYVSHFATCPQSRQWRKQT